MVFYFSPITVIPRDFINPENFLPRELPPNFPSKFLPVLRVFHALVDQRVDRNGEQTKGLVKLEGGITVMKLPESPGKESFPGGKKESTSSGGGKGSGKEGKKAEGQSVKIEVFKAVERKVEGKKLPQEKQSEIKGKESEKLQSSRGQAEKTEKTPKLLMAIVKFPSKEKPAPPLGHSMIREKGGNSLPLPPMPKVKQEKEVRGEKSLPVKKGEGERLGTEKKKTLPMLKGQKIGKEKSLAVQNKHKKLIEKAKPVIASVKSMVRKPKKLQGRFPVEGRVFKNVEAKKTFVRALSTVYKNVPQVFSRKRLAAASVKLPSKDKNVESQKNLRSENCRSKVDFASEKRQPMSQKVGKENSSYLGTQLSFFAKNKPFSKFRISEKSFSVAAGTLTALGRSGSSKERLSSENFGVGNRSELKGEESTPREVKQGRLPHEMHLAIGSIAIGFNQAVEGEEGGGRRLKSGKRNLPIKRCYLSTLLFVVLSAMVAGAKTIDEIFLFMEKRRKWFEAILGVKSPSLLGLPSREMMYSLLLALDGKTLEATIFPWLEELRGKKARFYGKRDQTPILPRLICWQTPLGLAIGQTMDTGESVAEEAMALLFQALYLPGVVTFVSGVKDGREVAAQIVKKGGAAIVEIPRVKGEPRQGKVFESFVEGEERILVNQVAEGEKFHLVVDYELMGKGGEEYHYVASGLSQPTDYFFNLFRLQQKLKGSAVWTLSLACSPAGAKEAVFRCQANLQSLRRYVEMFLTNGLGGENSVRLAMKKARRDRNLLLKFLTF